MVVSAQHQALEARPSGSHAPAGAVSTCPWWSVSGVGLFATGAYRLLA